MLEDGGWDELRFVFLSLEKNDERSGILDVGSLEQFMLFSGFTIFLVELNWCFWPWEFVW